MLQTYLHYFGIEKLIRDFGVPALDSKSNLPLSGESYFVFKVQVAEYQR
jgi:hypothetical protein